MNGFRYWLADMISGGELTSQRNNVEWWRDHMIGEVYGPMVDDKNMELIHLHKSNKSLHDSIEKLMACGAEILGREIVANQRLTRIAALETPYANATVRKMAKIARGEV
jgi:hypothetical protein